MPIPILVKLIKKEQLSKQLNRFKDQNTRWDSIYQVHKGYQSLRGVPLSVSTKYFSILLMTQQRCDTHVKLADEELVTRLAPFNLLGQGRCVELTEMSLR